MNWTRTAAGWPGFRRPEGRFQVEGASGGQGLSPCTHFCFQAAPLARQLNLPMSKKRAAQADILVVQISHFLRFVPDSEFFRPSRTTHARPQDMMTGFACVGQRAGTAFARGWLEHVQCQGRGGSRWLRKGRLPEFRTVEAAIPWQESANLAVSNKHEPVDCQFSRLRLLQASGAR